MLFAPTVKFRLVQEGVGLFNWTQTPFNGFVLTNANA